MKKALIYTLIVLVVIGLAVFVGYLYVTKLGTTTEVSKEPNIIPTNEIQEKVEKKVQIFQGTDRPIAIMIDNHKDAMPHAGLSKAYIVYEIIVEGGESRLMALFKGTDVDKIGPVRSARHYFIDFALENDAIYTHYGWSPQAESDIKSMKINNINGISEKTSDFWRVKEKAAPHNVLTSTEKIYNIAKNKGYRTTSDVSSVLNYTVDEVNLEEIYKTTAENEEAKTANEIKIPYSKSNIASWTYNEETRRYSRYSKNIKETEWFEETDVTAKNIIIEFIKNSSIDEKDRQTMNTTGTHNGYYITNGKAIPILCSKASRTSQTAYKDTNGNEIEVNDGNTFIQICPEGANVEIN